ncbi:MAG: lipoprotein [Xanthomonadaceae bacterium]|nr:lipoprotein [Xanthomonadaceae bacterium]MDE1885322.1 lipoprotein [Xanthomonadaceae bacterium]MDE1961985.1 lipoprotein [Xanthomonadaceae bacterium]MDE2083979.1 lipoprotein [Xanthomonadaceae bacterium]MDE2257188.1 lipoprotein [Xanthomonadaceae bacterium]
MTRAFRPMLIALFAAIALTACGNKGPLVLPDKAPQTQPQKPATSPAPAPESGKR